MIRLSPDKIGKKYLLFIFTPRKGDHPVGDWLEAGAGPMQLVICALFGTAAFITVEIWKVFRRGSEEKEKRTVGQDRTAERQCRQLDDLKRRLEGQDALLQEIWQQLSSLAQKEKR